MRDEVFQPLGMSTASVGLPRESGVAEGWGGHEKTPDGYKPLLGDRPGLAGIAPAGLMSCSIEDFAKLGAALVEVESGKATDFLSAAAVERLPELRPGSKGGEGEVFLGGDGHYTAAFAIWPSRGVSVVVQTNAGDSDDVCEALVEAARAAAAPEIPSRSGRSGSPSGRPRFGFAIQADGDDGAWTVGSVTPDSPAATGGLKEGDRILAINGTRLATLSEEARLEAVRRSPLTLRVERDGSPVDISLSLPDGR